MHPRRFRLIKASLDQCFVRKSDIIWNGQVSLIKLKGWTTFYTSPYLQTNSCKCLHLLHPLSKIEEFTCLCEKVNLICYLHDIDTEGSWYLIYRYVLPNVGIKSCFHCKDRQLHLQCSDCVVHRVIMEPLWWKSC